MVTKTIQIILFFLLSVHVVLSRSNIKESSYKDIVQLIRSELQNNPDLHHSAFERTALFSDTFGPRLWGSKQLELAISDVYEQLIKEGFENPELLPIKNITHWVRGREQLTLYSPRPFPTNIPLIGKNKFKSMEKAD